MAPNWSFSVLVLFSFAAANAYQYCSPQDCKNEVNALLSNPSPLCQDTTPVENAILKCIRYQNGIECPNDVRQQMNPVAQNVEKTINQACPARAARAESCPLIQMVGCLTQFASVLAAPNLFPLDDMEEFCRDLRGVTDAIATCVDCAGSYFGNWATVQLDVQFATNVSKALLNGGCTCATNITRMVNNINNNSTCRLVEDISGIAKTIASKCIVPSISSVKTFDWLTMTDTLLTTVLTLSQNACIFFNGGPATVASSTYIILSALFATVILSFKFNS